MLRTRRKGWALAVAAGFAYHNKGASLHLVPIAPTPACLISVI